MEKILIKMACSAILYSALMHMHFYLNTIVLSYRLNCFLVYNIHCNVILLFVIVLFNFSMGVNSSKQPIYSWCALSALMLSCSLRLTRNAARFLCSLMLSQINLLTIKVVVCHLQICIMTSMVTNIFKKIKMRMMIRLRTIKTTTILWKSIKGELQPL